MSVLLKISLHSIFKLFKIKNILLSFRKNSVNYDMEVFNLFRYIKTLIDLYTKPTIKKRENQNDKAIEESLSENIKYFKDQFDGSADLTVREIDIDGTKAAIISIEGMINKETLANSVINPIMRGDYKKKDALDKYLYLRDSLLSTSEQVEVNTYEQAFKLAMSGFVLLAVDGCAFILAVGIQGFSFRSVSEPNSEVMQRGSNEGFVEPLRINMTLIRRRIKNPKLKFETMQLGTISKTDIALCYLTDIVSSKILNEVKARLQEVDLDTIIASGYITPYLEDKKDLSFFSGVGISERPDTVCGKISEGRIAILVDGVPDVIIVPYLFVEYFQTLDDYESRPYFATFTRWLKYLAFFISAFFPGLYVTIGTFNPELFPDELLNKIAVSVSETPFNLMIEALIIHFIYEIMREAGLRLPKTLGHAVSIVGALVIGEAAVNSSLIGAPTLMILAITAISSYVIPKLYEPIAILRFIFIIIGGTMGIWGIMLLFSAILVNICAKNSFGVPFTAPLSPFSLFGMRDVAIRAGWKILGKRENVVQTMPGSNVRDEES